MKDKKKTIECVQKGPFEFEISSNELKELDFTEINEVIRNILNAVMHQQIPEHTAKLIKTMHTEIIIARCTIVFELILLILIKFGG